MSISARLRVCRSPLAVPAFDFPGVIAEPCWERKVFGPEGLEAKAASLSLLSPPCGSHSPFSLPCTTTPLFTKLREPSNSQLGNGSK
ncbi:mCG148472 [Mus musculus]|nr:mCG148472 [Mus musculus]